MDRIRDTLPTNIYPDRLGESARDVVAQAAAQAGATPTATSEGEGHGWLGRLLARRQAKNSSAMARYQMALQAVHQAGHPTDAQLDELSVAAAATGIDDETMASHQQLLVDAALAAKEAAASSNALANYQAANAACRKHDEEVLGPATAEAHRLAAERDRLGDYYSMHRDDQAKADGLARQVQELLGTAS